MCRTVRWRDAVRAPGGRARSPGWPRSAAPPPPAWRLEAPRLPSRYLARAVDRDRDLPAVVDVDALDARARRIAQAERLGALREGALLARLDQGEATIAAAAAQRFRGTGAVGELRVGAHQEHEARLVIAGRRHHLVVAIVRLQRARNRG